MQMMSETSDIQAESLLPEEVMLHRGPMLLLNRLGTFEESRMTAYVDVSADSSFFVAGAGVPLWIGIEYMAQAIAAHGGIRAKYAGRPIPLGLLIGCHNFTGNVSHFAEGARLTVRATELVADAEGLGAYDCAIEAEGIEVSARLTVFVSPDANLDDVLERNRRQLRSAGS